MAEEKKKRSLVWYLWNPEIHVEYMGAIYSALIIFIVLALYALFDRSTIIRLYHWMGETTFTKRWVLWFLWIAFVLLLVLWLASMYRELSPSQKEKREKIRQSKVVQENKEWKLKRREEEEKVRKEERQQYENAIDDEYAEFKAIRPMFKYFEATCDLLRDHGTPEQKIPKDVTDYYFANGILTKNQLGWYCLSTKGIEFNKRRVNEKVNKKKK